MLMIDWWGGIALFGLGKVRSKYGEFLDRHGVRQEDVAKLTGLNRDTVSEACNNAKYTPRKSTMNLLLSALRELADKQVSKQDFWTM